MRTSLTTLLIKCVGMPLGLLLITACSTQDRAFVQELEDMPGIECTVNDGLSHCGPDDPSTWDGQNN